MEFFLSCELDEETPSEDFLNIIEIPLNNLKHPQKYLRHILGSLNLQKDVYFLNNLSLCLDSSNKSQGIR